MRKDFPSTIPAVPKPDNLYKYRIGKPALSKSSQNKLFPHHQNLKHNKSLLNCRNVDLIWLKHEFKKQKILKKNESCYESFCPGITDPKTFIKYKILFSF